MTPGMTALLSRESHPRRCAVLRHRARSRARTRALEALEDRIAPATFLVVNALDGPGDGPRGSLRNAIALANQSDDAHDVVVIAPGVTRSIVLSAGELAIDDNLTLVNRSGGPIEIRQATSGARVFDVANDSAVTRVNIGGASARELLAITGGNVATGDGGGILVENPATVLTLTNAWVVGNSAGLASSSSTAQNGGGIDSSGRVVLVQSVVSGNQTSGNGGGIWAGAGVATTASAVLGNKVGTSGGGLYVNQGNATIASGSSVSVNTAALGTGGGVYVVKGNMTVSRSQVNGNRAKDVGGINETQGIVRVVNGSQVNGNSSTARLNVSTRDFGGGGIYVGAGSVFVSRSQVSFNHSVGMYSSGIVIGLGGVTVTGRSQIIGNRNNGPGGGIAANFGGTVTVSGGSQVSYNVGAGNGGGIVNFAGPLGGVRIVGGSEVSHNVVTNYESLGQAIGVFLQLLAGNLGLNFTTATGGTSPAGLSADIAQIEQEVASTQGGSALGAPGFVVSGGGIGTLLGGSITVVGSHVDNNISGVRVSTGNPRSIGIGGGLFSGLGPVTVKGSTLNGNSALGSGGAIWNLGSMNLLGTSIAGNTALRAPGGGLYNGSSASASIVGGLIQGNRASDGGGIFNSGTLSLADSAVVGNRATIQGGGITNAGQMTLTRTPVVGNTPDDIFPPP